MTKVFKTIGIYKITNTANSKIYIGSTTRLKDRFNFHQSLLNRGSHHSVYLQRSFDKHIDVNFDFEVIECIMIKDRDYILEREQYYIDLLKPEYNNSKTAGSNLNLRNPKKWKAVLQYSLEGNLIKLWDNLTDIMTHFNVSSSSKISDCCMGKRNKAYGFVWRYKDNNIGFSLSTRRKGKGIYLLNEDNSINKYWHHLQDCAIELNTTPQRICAVLNPTKSHKFINKIIYKLIREKDYRKILENETNINIY